MPRSNSAPSIAVILPCLNEEAAIAETVAAFQKALPDADIYVFDNDSTDRTSQVAMRAGAHVRRESRRGKGNVIRRAFADIDADVYVMADGDGTYCADSAPAMIERLLRDGLDMVTGCREHTQIAAYRTGHVLGNKLFNRIVSGLFGSGISDLFSGYRVLSRRFVKSFPSMSEGFEIEAEMSIHALQLRMPLAEQTTRYAPRRAGSHSKLSTLRDGFRILVYVMRLQRLFRPRNFYGFFGVLFLLTSFGLGIPIVITFLEIGQVPRFPTAILATGLSLVGALLWLLGLVLESMSQQGLEARRLSYLSLAAPVAPRAEQRRTSQRPRAIGE